MKQETFDRISGLTSIKDTNILRNILMRMSEDLHDEGLDKEDIIEFFQKVVELEIDDILDDEEENKRTNSCEMVNRAFKLG